MRNQRTLAALVLVVLLGGAFLAGYGYGQGRAVGGGDADSQGFALLREVLRQIRQTYSGRGVDATRLFYGAARGMVEALGDPYSRFLDPAAFKEIRDDFSGIVYGVGIFVEVKQGRPVVVQPIGGTPAHRAGLRPGDRILAVNGVDTEGMSLEEVVARIRGPAGTKVTLRIGRGTRVNDVTLVRTRIANVSVQGDEFLAPALRRSLREAGVAYVRLLTFVETTGPDFRKAWRSARARGARGLLLDLRNNPGGLLDVAVEVANPFLSAGQPIVHVVDRNGRRETHRASGGEKISLPVVILVNEYSASASEIVAGALRDHGIAPLVGLPTFGKGVIQSIVTLPQGSGATLTSGKYLTPDGHDINGRGLTPDVLVGAKQEGRPDAEIERIEVAQLTRALAVLKQRIAGR